MTPPLEPTSTGAPACPPRPLPVAKEGLYITPLPLLSTPPPATLLVGERCRGALGSTAKLPLPMITLPPLPVLPTPIPLPPPLGPTLTGEPDCPPRPLPVAKEL